MQKVADMGSRLLEVARMVGLDALPVNYAAVAPIVGEEPLLPKEEYCCDMATD